MKKGKLEPEVEGNGACSFFVMKHTEHVGPYFGDAFLNVHVHVVVFWLIGRSLFSCSWCQWCSD